MSMSAGFPLSVGRVHFLVDFVDFLLIIVMNTR